MAIIISNSIGLTITDTDLRSDFQYGFNHSKAIQDAIEHLSELASGGSVYIHAQLPLLQPDENELSGNEFPDPIFLRSNVTINGLGNTVRVFQADRNTPFIVCTDNTEGAGVRDLTVEIYDAVIGDSDGGSDENSPDITRLAPVIELYTTRGDIVSHCLFEDIRIVNKTKNSFAHRHDAILIEAENSSNIEYNSFKRIWTEAVRSHLTMSAKSNSFIESNYFHLAYCNDYEVFLNIEGEWTQRNIFNRLLSDAVCYTAYGVRLLGGQFNQFIDVMSIDHQSLSCYPQETWKIGENAEYNFIASTITICHCDDGDDTNWLFILATRDNTCGETGCRGSTSGECGASSPYPGSIDVNPCHYDIDLVL